MGLLAHRGSGTPNDVGERAPKEGPRGRSRRRRKAGSEERGRGVHPAAAAAAQAANVPETHGVDGAARGHLPSPESGCGETESRSVGHRWAERRRWEGEKQAQEVGGCRQVGGAGLHRVAPSPRAEACILREMYGNP